MPKSYWILSSWRYFLIFLLLNTNTIIVPIKTNILVHASNSNFFPPKTVLTWVNGIGFNMGHMTNGQSSLSAIFGNRPVLFCHNPTAMVNEDDTFGYIGDLTQATTQKLGKITAEVDELVK
jgi:hypothetical protein